MPRGVRAPVKERKVAWIGVRFTDMEEYQRLRKAARREDRSLSSYIRVALAQKVREHENA